MTCAGVDVSLVTAMAWDEGGRRVPCVPRPGEQVLPVRTWGNHPALFVYDPRPIWRLMRSRRFDVIDVHEEPYSLAVAELRVLRRLLVPGAHLLLYSAQNIFKRYLWPIRILEKGALRSASAIYPCSTGASDVLRRKGFRGLLQVLPLGVDLDRFTPAEVPTSEPTGLRLAYVGRLVPEKGVDLILAAMADEPDWALEILGTGPMEQDLRAQAGSLGMADRVDFLGSVGQDQLPDAYRRAHVLVVPSLETPAWTEQFCRVAVEAMACGVPVVASAVGSLPEVVGDGGLLVAPGSAAELHSALHRLAGDKELRRRLGLNGRQASRNYSWPAVGSAHARLYRRVLRSDGPTAPPQVLVVAYGAPDDLAASLRALAGEFDVTVVDNSSSPACRSVAAEAGALYVDPGANLGFAAGVNCGLASIGAPLPDVLLLNPDAIIEPAAIRALQDQLHSRPRTAAVAPALIGFDGEEQRVAWPFPSPCRMWAEAVGLARVLASVSPSGFMIGAVLLLRAEALAEIGPFDERFFLYSEETDWQRRATKAGWTVAHCPEVHARHRGAGTSSDPVLREARFHSGIETYIRKWHGSAGWQSYRAAALLAAALRTARPESVGRQEARARVALYAKGPRRHLGAIAGAGQE